MELSRKQRMSKSDSWFTIKNSNKYQINSIIIYNHLSTQICDFLDEDRSISDIIEWLKNETIKKFTSKFNQKPTDGAINNSIGRWNEFIATTLFSEIALDIYDKYEIIPAIFRLPNSRFSTKDKDGYFNKFLSLFLDHKSEKSENLDKLANFKNKIFFSSPDYVIALTENNRLNQDVQLLLEQQSCKPDSFDLYELLRGKLGIENLKAVVSLKTSNRPDRRYQPMFEAARIKAISFILEQEWQYYMVTSQLSLSDENIFNEVISPHGIALQQDIKLVDGTYTYNCKSDLSLLVYRALKL